MPNCYHCGEGIIGEGYQCSECGQIYCPLHQNPINHDCNIVKESASLSPYQPVAQAPQYTTPSYVSTPRTDPSIQDQINYQQHPSAAYTDSASGPGVRGTTDGSYTWYHQEKAIPPNAFDPESGIEFKGIFLAHKSEFFHFLIGASLIFILGLISFLPQVLNFVPLFDQLNEFFTPEQLALLGVTWTSADLIWMLFLLAGFFMLAFLFHEFGHRQTARHFKLQTKFRLLTIGMYLTFFGLALGVTTLLTSGSPIIPPALPGAVVVLGLDKINKQTGWCKSAGPIVNLVFGTILLIISLMIPPTLFPLNLFIGLAAALNFTLGTFNMIPLGILDGQNIWKWNKTMYFLLMISLITLLVITYSLFYLPSAQSPYIPDTLKPFFL